MLAVSGDSHHGILHVGGVVGVDGADLFDGDDLVAVDEGIGVGVGEEEQDIGLGAGLEVGQNLGLPLLIGSGGAIVDLVASGSFVGSDSVLEVLAVAIIAAVGGDDVQGDGVGVCADDKAQAHSDDEQECSDLFHDVRSFNLIVTFHSCQCLHYTKSKQYAQSPRLWFIVHPWHLA